ncbi:MAG: hypothetical protein ABEK10_01290, partial [Candidatus Nanosalina sp.]
MVDAEIFRRYSRTIVYGFVSFLVLLFGVPFWLSPDYGFIGTLMVLTGLLFMYLSNKNYKKVK